MGFDAKHGMKTEMWKVAMRERMGTRARMGMRERWVEGTHGYERWYGYDVSYYFMKLMLQFFDSN